MHTTTAPTKSTASPERKRLYSEVHQAAKACGLEGDSYRLVLLGLTGSKTSTALTDEQIKQAILEFRKLAQEAYWQRVECSTEALAAEYGF